MPRPKFSERFQPIAPWVEDNIYLDENTAIPGRIKLFPWQTPILEAYQNPRVQQISMMCSSQIGKSVMSLCICGYHVGVSPCNILLVQPGIKTLKRFRAEKFEPMINASPSLTHSIHKTQVGTIPQDHIPFNGGNIFTAYAGSSASMKSISVPLVIADEIDEYSGNEDTANPLSILWQRTSSFGRRAKMICVSTPTSQGSSLIEQEYNSSSMGVYYVPCPHCDLFHQIEWDNVRQGELFCPGCGAHITERQRIRMIMSEKGYWHEQQENERHKGYHINQLYSTWKTLSDTSAEYNENNKRGFYTQVLGLPFRSLVNDEVTPEEVLSLYEEDWDIGDGPLTKNDVDSITAAVDIQGNRLEVHFVYWKGRMPRTDRVERIPLIEANPDGAYMALNNRLFDYMPDMIFMDRHYPSPDDVRYYAEKYLNFWITSGRMMLTVGSSPTFNKPLIVKRPTAKDPFYLSMASDTAKEWVFSLVSNKSMSINNAEGAVPDDWHTQLAAEELRWVVSQSGKETKKFVKTKRNNEALDTMYMNLCAHEYLGDDFSRQNRLSWDDLDSINV